MTRQPPTPEPNAQNASNWYAKLHPIGTAPARDTPTRPLNLSIFFRIWLVVALVLLLCGVVAFSQLFGYIKPTAHQVIEDTLADTSTLLAATLQQPLISKRLYDEDYQRQLDESLQRRYATKKDINGIVSDDSVASFRVYVTDAAGKVVYDSQPAPDNAETEDYSRWNDVYLTLRGEYGARSTVQPTYSDDAVMYVAQPIKNPAGNTIGVVSVGKPVASVLPYLSATRQRMLATALLMTGAALILAGLVAWWLKQSITLVTHYTRALAEDRQKPYFYLGRELNSLTDTIESMKHRLENRAYVSDYVHTLTHELKSPLTAIRASSELLEDEALDIEDRHMLSQTIGEQSIKMQQLIDRLLLLAAVEQPSFRLNRQPIDIVALLRSLLNDNNVKLQQSGLAPIAIHINGMSDADTTTDTLIYIFADRFWLVQALQNILDNALYFAATSVQIQLYHHDNQLQLEIINDGKLLPEYALDKVFNRYFSLSRQSMESATSDISATRASTHKKGTGLGLTLVKQVIEHHGGGVAMQNIRRDGADSSDAAQLPALTGVALRLWLPTIPAPSE